MQSLWILILISYLLPVFIYLLIYLLYTYTQLAVHFTPIFGVLYGVYGVRKPKKKGKSVTM
ncbi:hypothetical protein J3Q64DRAFT_1747091 [Phycomyces blakesleeanus]|uniref:Uncharacterized protein n=1 Tax=Phycomyces blakesleeanus TaxID=4837 RepID=A0ABR3AWL8_PHYBL